MEPRIAIPRGTYEHISMACDEIETVEPNFIDAELEQSGRLAGQRITIFNGTHLGIGSITQPPKKLSHHVNLAFVDPRPVSRLDWRGKVAVTAMAIAGSVAILIAARLSLHLDIHQAIALLALIVATLAGLGATLRERAKETVFLTRHGRVPLVRFCGRTARQDGNRDFLRLLVHSIRRAHGERLRERGTLLRDEMKEHRRLADEGLLSAKQFQSARALILRAHDQESMISAATE